jgi:phospholipase/carboxylesterase
MTRLILAALTLLTCAIRAGSTAAGDLTYLAHAPVPAAGHPPLIILLHGAGADERDMIGLWHDLPKDFVVISPRAPFGGGGFRWYRKAGAAPRTDDIALSEKLIDLVVDNAVERFAADPTRIFIGGFSQGAVMTYAIALREPGRFRGAAILSGSLFGSTIAKLPRADRTHVSFFIGHGTADPRIPLAGATSARAALTKLGVPVTFHVYPGMGHETGATELHDFGAWVGECAQSAGADR